MMKNLFILFLKTQLLEGELFIHTHTIHSDPFSMRLDHPAPIVTASTNFMKEHLISGMTFYVN